MKRYEIRWIAFDPIRGAEMGNTRPAVIVSQDALNRRLQTVAVCPLTSQLHPTWRSRVQVRCGGRPAEVAVDQIRTVSKIRLGDRIGSLNKDEVPPCGVSSPRCTANSRCDTQAGKGGHERDGRPRS